MKKMSVVVGGLVVVIPGTSLNIRCPVSKFNQKHIKWQKDGRYIRLRRRIQVNNKGILKIRDSRLQDEATYTCVASDTRADITIHFQTPQRGSELYEERVPFLRKVRKENKRTGIIKSREKRKHPVNTPHPEIQADEGSLRNTAARKRNKSRRLSSLSFVAQQWSDCSVSCGEGVRSRIVRCEQVYKNYFRILPDKECLAKDFMKPASVERCFKKQVCAGWSAGPWQECSKSECEAKGLSTRHRDISCTTENGTKVDTSHCSSLKKPNSTSKCSQPACQARWKPSDWGSCSKSCGEGYKYRSLRCAWETDGRPCSQSFCSDLKAPATSKLCFSHCAA